MKIGDIVSFLESKAPAVLQESYDNAGLITGNPGWDCTGVLCTLDSTEAIIDEAIHRGCNLVVAHHPIVFRGLKRINGGNYVERTIIKAIKADIAILAVHTNLDNVLEGVSGRMAERLGLKNCRVLLPKVQVLKKLFTFVPVAHAEKVKNALFEAGSGVIGKYAECSFSVEGSGTFKAGDGTDPFVGKIGERHTEPEVRLEVIYPSFLEKGLLKALFESHPYEEVAYDLVPLSNVHQGIGTGIVGELDTPLSEAGFLGLLKSSFRLELVRHTRFPGRPIKKVALCGGAGSFLINNALSSNVDAYVTADIKYHEFFDADNRLLLCDIGHFESEQFTTDLLTELLQQKFPTFAVLKSDQKTNPVYNYF